LRGSFFVFIPLRGELIALIWPLEEECRLQIGVLSVPPNALAEHLEERVHVGKLLLVY
jgi:hypothetical protein